MQSLLIRYLLSEYCIYQDPVGKSLKIYWISLSFMIIKQIKFVSSTQATINWVILWFKIFPFQEVADFAE